MTTRKKRAAKVQCRFCRGYFLRDEFVAHVYAQHRDEAHRLLEKKSQSSGSSTGMGLFGPHTATNETKKKDVALSDRPQILCCVCESTPPLPGENTCYSCKSD